MLNRWGLAVAMAVLVALSGCVTTENSSFNDKRDPQRALAFSLQAARSYIAQRNWEDAQRHLRTALSIDDRNAEVHEALALVFQNTGEYELAERHFRRAISLDGKAARLRNNFAAFLYARGNYREAETQLERVVEDVLYERRDRAFLNLGLARMWLEKYDGAREAFERALMMDKQNLLTIFQLAEVYYQLGEFEKAQQYYTLYRERVPRQSADGLWLGIRLADKFGDVNARASYALALRNLYPQSDEYLKYVSVYGDAKK